MKRSKFIQQASIFSAGLLVSKNVLSAAAPRISKRPPIGKRNFTSKAVEDAITQF
ncbi:MAG: metal-independent alpha-mannosidase, partial [Sphingobacteriaceae bacterium]